MSKVLFIAPTSKKLNLAADLSAVSNGNELEDVADGLIDRAGVEVRLRNSQAEILYLASDGDYGVLQLNGPDGTSDLLEENDLVQMLKPMSGRLRLVVINACKSLGLGTAIHNRYHIPVIAMERPIGDAAAIQYARSLFTALRMGTSINDAHDAARQTINRLHPDFANVVRLLNGDMTTNGQLDAFMLELRQDLVAVRTLVAGLETRVIHCETALTSRLPPATGWREWFNMGLSLLVSLLVILLLMRTL